MSPISAEVLGITFPHTHESSINGFRLGNNLAILLKDYDDGGKAIIARKNINSTNPKDFDVLKVIELKTGESKCIRTNVVDPDTKEKKIADIKFRGE